MTRTLALCALITAFSAVPACVAVDGGHTENVTRPTAGQELVDLKTALDKGIITQEQFDKKKQQILAQR